MTGLSPPIQTALLWALWCFLHSFLITPWWTGRVFALLGERFAAGWYRVFFISISLGTLIPVVSHHMSLPQVVLFTWPGWWLGVKIVLAVYGAYMFYAGLRRYDMSFFLGLSQLRAYFTGAAVPRSTFTAARIGGVRHPWYSGGIALVWAFGPITDVSLVGKIVISVYFVIGAFLEEKKLLAEIGAPYAEYRRELPMLFPWPGVRR
jgi:protein-S-isoprenylcysteine O-methyltransferase Ste14